jgi:hypothetical protein
MKSFSILATFLVASSRLLLVKSFVIPSGETQTVPTLACEPISDGCSLACPEATYDLTAAVVDSANRQLVFTTVVADQNFDFSVPLCGIKSRNDNLRSNKPFIGTYDPGSWKHEFLGNGKISFGFTFTDGPVCSTGIKKTTNVRLVCDKTVESDSSPLVTVSSNPASCIGKFVLSHHPIMIVVPNCSGGLSQILSRSSLLQIALQ